MLRHFQAVDDFIEVYKPKGRTLVVGSKVYEKKAIDRRGLYGDAIGLDMQEGEGVDIVHDLEQPLAKEIGLFHHIDCVSVMEHCQRPWLMAENIQRAMHPGGTILLSVPFVWRTHGYPSDYWRFTTESFSVLFPSVKWQIRGYLSGETFRKLSNRIDHNGKKYIERCEAIGFGMRLQ